MFFFHLSDFIKTTFFSMAWKLVFHGHLQLICYQWPCLWAPCWMVQMSSLYYIAFHHSTSFSLHILFRALGKAGIVLCKARPEAVSQAKPSPNRPSQARPYWRLHDGFGLACILEKPKPSRQAAAFQYEYLIIFWYFEFFIYLFYYLLSHHLDSLAVALWLFAMSHVRVTVLSNVNSYHQHYHFEVSHHPKASPLQPYHHIYARKGLTRMESEGKGRGRGRRAGEGWWQEAWDATRLEPGMFYYYYYLNSAIFLLQTTTTHADWEPELRRHFQIDPFST